MTLEAASRSAVIGLSMLTTVAILGVVVSAAYQDSRHGPESSEPPLIRVPQLPWKLPPESRLDDAGPAAYEARGLDRLLPEAGDEPGAVPAVQSIAARADDPVLTPAAAIEPLPAASPAPSEPLPVARSAAIASEPLPAARSAPNESLPAARSAMTGPPPAAPPATVKSAHAPALPPAPIGPAPAAGAEYRVQLLATTDQAAAERAWNGLVTRFGALLADYRSHIEKAELPAGSMYRVQIGPFDGLAAAEAKCAELKRQQTACFALRVGPRT